MGILAASLADLATALAADGLDAWLAGLESEALRSRICRALAIDRRLCAQYPDSLASCLLARTFGDPEFAELHAAWTRALEQGARPWIRPLRALPVADGLVAELHAGPGLAFTGLQLPRFTSNGEVESPCPSRGPGCSTRPIRGSPPATRCTSSCAGREPSRTVGWCGIIQRPAVVILDGKSAED